MKNKTSQESDEGKLDGRTIFARHKLEQNRHKILAAAVKSFGKKGYQAVTIEDVLKSANVGRATFYNHFKSKADLFNTLLSEIVEEIYNSVQPIKHEPEDATTVQQITANLDRMLDIFEHHRGVGTIVMREAYTADAECQTHIKRFFDHLIELTKNSLIKGINSGLLEMPKENADSIAKIFVGSFREVIFIPLSFGEITSERARELSQILLGYHLCAIRNYMSCKKQQSQPAG